jgi:hypothetical protein
MLLATLLSFSYSKVESSTSYGQGTLRRQLRTLRTHTHMSIGLLGELGLVDVDALPGGALAAGLVRGAQTALLPHLAVPLLPQLLPASLASAAAPCKRRGNHSVRASNISEHIR